MSVASPLRRTTSASLAALLLVALGACATPTPEPAPAGTSVETEPSVTPTPSPSDVVALGDFGFTSFGSATLDASDVEALEIAWGSPLEVPAECPWFPLVATHGTDNETRAFFDPRGIDAGVRFFYTLAFSDSSDAPLTAEGIGVGSTEAEVLAAYPDAVADDYEDVSIGVVRRLTVEDPASDSRYVFGISAGHTTVDLVQWGPEAGGQWAHLCLPL